MFLTIQKRGLLCSLCEEATLNGAEGLAKEMEGIQRQVSTLAGLCVENRTLLLRFVGPSATNCQGYYGLIVSVWLGGHGLQDPDQSRVSMCSQASWVRSHCGVSISMFLLARQSLPLRPGFFGQVLDQGGPGSLANFSKLLDPGEQK